MVTALILIFMGYLSGALPFGVWTGKICKGIDVREHGSGSTGATNVYRCVGPAAGAFVFIADNLKGTLPVLLAMHYESTGTFSDQQTYTHVIPALVAVAALIGHSKSVFLNFSGGKSAAVGLGTLFALNPLGGLFTCITFFSMCFLTKIVSVASITAVFMCGVYFYLLHSPIEYVIYCIFGFLYVTYRHKANIKRLMNGTEPRIGQKPPTLPPGDSDVNNRDSKAALQ
jgi:glycerol-3-phosphate acyltransferase PlsY